MRPTHGLQPCEKITAAKDFARLKQKGVRTRGTTLMYVRCPNNQPDARIGFIITRKTGNAVIRNKWKRTFREFFRQHKSLFDKGIDHLWIVKSTYKGKPPKTTHQEIQKLIRASQSLQHS